MKFTGRSGMWVFTLESASCRRSGAKNLDVTLRIFKILWIPALDTENIN